MTRHRKSLVVAGVLTIPVLAVLWVLWSQLPGIGAGALLHPSRRPLSTLRPSGCDEVTVAGDGVRLKGWACHTTAQRRGTIVALHGVADNRAGASGVISRYVSRGFDVIAFDSRGHGESEGDTCTYGFHEKDDLKRIVDTVEHGSVILFGTSLGAAVALQEAGNDPRVTAVVAAESFSDLRTVARERAPFVFTDGSIDRAFALAERLGHFRVDDVSPQRAAASIRVPVLLIHGAADVDTPPSHSRRIYDALRGLKRLVLVPGVGHNHSLQPEVWPEIDAWIEQVLKTSDP